MGYPNERFLSQLSLLASCVSAFCGGIVYTFSLYGPQIAKQLNYTSLQVNSIAMAGNLGVFLSTPLFGYFSDIYPPGRVTLISTFLFPLGFSLMSLTYDGILPRSPVLMAMYYFLVGAAGGCAYISATSASGHNFKHRRGFGIGLPVTFFGISAFLFAQVYHAFFVENGVPYTSAFIRFMAVSTSILTFISGRFLIKLNYTQLQDGLEVEIAGTDTMPSYDPDVNDISGWDLYHNWDARMLFLSILIIGGSGLMYINNVGTMLHTLLAKAGQDDRLPALQSLNVSIISLLSCCGRLFFTFTSDSFVTKFQVTRITYLLVSAIILSLSMFLSGYVSANYMSVTSAIMGLGYGTMFAVAPTLTSMWFGTTRFGTNWGWLNLGPAAGGQLFSLMFGLIYDFHLPSSKDGGNLMCLKGNNCYRASFQLAGIACAGSAIVVAWLARKRALRIGI